MGLQLQPASIALATPWKTSHPVLGWETQYFTTYSPYNLFVESCHPLVAPQCTTTPCDHSHPSTHLLLAPASLLSRIQPHSQYHPGDHPTGSNASRLILHRWRCYVNLLDSAGGNKCAQAIRTSRPPRISMLYCHCCSLLTRRVCAKHVK